MSSNVASGDEISIVIFILPVRDWMVINVNLRLDTVRWVAPARREMSLWTKINDAKYLGKLVTRTV